MSSPPYRRIVRRETHSPRTAAVLVVVTILILGLLYAGTEIVLDLLGQPALLVAPADVGDWIAELPQLQPAAAIIAGGVAIAIIGLVLVILSLAPGRLAKHEMRWEDRAIVVDNDVIAAALASRICDETGLAREQVTVGVSHRTVRVDIAPGAGLPVDEGPVRGIIEAEIDAYELAPRVTKKVHIDRRQIVAP
ncbi:DNA/RNA endonuclease G [Agromyces sp. ISL-38]|uniref:DUF6286 domain-containing protein n=1 Tax=Agromyces sp. ISL-38 TaxID=2819107 RepID=UPI001BE68077|nr:DUF6286 domain-containing protein [Agromyces sp. ISL-38]MBT2500600.1 DNA/RNA endonuclease G [Agromyces sp. ISL-38]